MNPRARLATVLVLVALVVLGAATASPWRFDLPVETLPTAPPPVDLLPTAAPTRSPLPDDLRPETTEDDGEWLALLGALIVTGIIALIVWVAVRRLRTLARPDENPDIDDLEPGATTDGTSEGVDLPALADAATHALDRLDDHAEPRDAVVAAWVALEHAAADQGAVRDPAQTPTEFTSTVLERTPATPGAVTTLRNLYQVARFTDRPVTTDQREQARTALREIARSLGVRS
ncbi:DUF4129 domain-containing protein [Antribacter gilvus]|uniref:DUF4129 domain-containing protein n=1 Tax=Antribacter gilvus TaxID=2304675 RepID=UPI000F782BD0|nr:DUF4129 domain-containing protein [Antribacter gilvus]